ncbi:putative bifunctional diguanylate cyclase/phosphodiesterase [Rhizobium sp. PAMB 3174]
MSVPAGNPELLKAQYQSFSRQLPVMYLILMTSTWALAATHMKIAPYWLTIIVPVIFTIGTALRIIHWWKSIGRKPTPELALQALTRTNRLAFLIAAAFAGWSYMLLPYGDAYTRSHVAFYMAITVISCIFCLTHLRSAAITVTVIVNGSFVAYFAMSGESTFVAIAINIALVSICMLFILFVNYANFNQMVLSRQKSEALSSENMRLANIDSLTSLPNRRAFFASLQNEFAAASEAGTRLGVGIVDLDGFKPVNDVYGHSTGDRLLFEVGARLTDLQSNGGATFFRIGGDEFAFLIPSAGDDAALMAFGEQICAGLQRPFILPEGRVMISGSAGIAVYPENAGTRDDLFTRADYALYNGKRSRRGRVSLFTEALDAQIVRETRIEQALKQADLAAEMSVLFQPIIDIRSNRTAAFEALARWQSPVLGSVPPMEFIAIAERTGLIAPLTRILLKKALAAAVEWPADVRLSFNLSPHDLNTRESALTILAIIENSKIDASRLDLEITETAFTHDFDQVLDSVEMLRGIGCGISLDDVGIGYSSFTRLHALPLTKMKIDRSFVTDLDRNPSSYKIVKSLLALSRDMQLDCVIEGVETEEERSALIQLGATLIQGYLYSRPLPEADAETFLARPVAETARIV